MARQNKHHASSASGPKPAAQQQRRDLFNLFGGSVTQPRTVPSIPHATASQIAARKKADADRAIATADRLTKTNLAIAHQAKRMDDLELTGKPKEKSALEKAKEGIEKGLRAARETERVIGEGKGGKKGFWKGERKRRMKMQERLDEWVKAADERVGRGLE